MPKKNVINGVVGSNSADKPKILFLGLTQELINSIMNGMFSNSHILAIISDDTNLQGRVIPSPKGLLFVVKPEEFKKFNFDFAIIVAENQQVTNFLINQLLAFKIDVKKIKVFHNKQILDINIQQTQILPLPDTKTKPRLYFDVSRIAQQDFQTGVQRVVRNVYRNIDDLTDHNIITTQFRQNEVVTARKFESYIYGYEFDYKEYLIEFAHNDKILFMDTIWNVEQYKYLAYIIESKKLKSYHFIHDIVPVLYPEYHRAALNFFEPCLKMMLKTQTAIICNSKVTADDVINYYNNQSIHRNTPLKIYYCHLGFEMDNVAGITVRSSIKEFVQRAKTFLMVGTIEIRKNHITALKALIKAMEQKPQEDIQLLIIGKLGWMVEEFVEFLSKNEKLKSKVMWLQDASDIELHWAYQNSTALIAASFTEGFGLPIVEAAHFGLPSICSDIPIFREVTDNNAIYFPPMDVEVLKNILLDWDNLKNSIDPRKIRLYSWQECSREILDIVDDKVEPYDILK